MIIRQAINNNTAICGQIIFKTTLPNGNIKVECERIEISAGGRVIPNKLGNILLTMNPEEYSRFIIDKKSQEK